MQKKKQGKFLKGFTFAWAGIIDNIWSERNMRIHVIAAGVVTLLGLLLGISGTEWLVLLIFFALIPALELVNSAVESTCDVVRDELHLSYGATKKPRDYAAGAVLWAAIFAAVAGIIIFVPKIVRFLFVWALYARWF